MTRTCFVIRPFGKKKFTRVIDGKKKTIEVDFEDIHNRLIQPAMEKADLVGGTTMLHKEAGNIRAAMFEGLASADLVIADISLLNANVFYELGARHGLMDRCTFMIRFDGEPTPFDIATDRYLQYEVGDLEASIPDLVRGLKQTLAGKDADSPIYQMLAALKPPDLMALCTVPDEYSKEVELAIERRQSGHLQLLAMEAMHFAWGNEGLRRIGRLQFKHKQLEDAVEIWTLLNGRTNGDYEASLILATIYERSRKLTESDQAIETALKLIDKNALPNHYAEVKALQGRNAKTRWLEAWRSKTTDIEKRREALRSSYLHEARNSYWQGFAQDLNHHFSGINALGLYTITLRLAEEFEDDWSELYDTEKEARTILEEIEVLQNRLSATVLLAIEREINRHEKGTDEWRWAMLSLAEAKLLSKEKPGRVSRVYANALTDAQDFFFNSAGRQLQLYLQLGVDTETIELILNENSKLRSELSHKNVLGAPTKIILFSGHRIDSSTRKVPRFPAEKEEAAREAIKQQVEAIRQANKGHEIVGMAGGANGGDILFHEVCYELGIPSQLYLVMPSDEYIPESVSVDGAPEWIQRFNVVFDRTHEQGNYFELQSRRKLPKWLGQKDEYYVWQRNTLWTLYTALSNGGRNTEVILLWDGKAGDGPGGTKDMSDKAKRRGAVVRHIDTRKIF